jgi:putative membrane protein
VAPEREAPIDEATVDASRRTRLANERTYLAWWRGGLTALAVGVGAGAVVPDLTSGSRWPFVALGVCFSVLAIAFIGYGVVRHRQVDRAIARGDYAPLSSAVAAVFGLAGVVLALLTIVVIALEA